MIRANKGQSGIIGLAMALVLWCSAAYATDPGNAPVAHWRFDEGGGPTAYDESANNNDGTLYNHTKFVPGKIGKALQFDGTDDYVEINDAASLNPGTQSMSISLWFKMNAAGSQDASILYNKENLFEASGGGGYFTYAWQPHWAWDGGTSFPVNVGEWYHAVVVYDKTNQYVYKNGILVYSRSQTGDMGTNTNALRIGARGAPGAPNAFFPGIIDDVRIYNYARTADQIMVDYNAGAAAHLGAGTDPNEGNAPVGYWNFDENTGTSAIDRSGNGNNGTITEAVWTSGRDGSALSFDGNNDTVSISNSSTLNLTNVGTIEAWVYANPQNYTTFYTILNKGDWGGARYGYRIYHQANAPETQYKFEISNNTSVQVTTVNITSGMWHHIAMVWDGTYLRGYVDGAQANSASQTLNVVNDTSALTIGMGSYSLNGKIDDVKIYNYARTPAQIAYDYNKGKPIAQYKFDEGTGTIAHNEYSTADTGASPVGWWRMDNNWNDSSGNANNGTANGDAAFSSSAKIGPYCGTFDGTGDYIDCGNGTSLQVSTDSGATWEAWIKTSVTAQQTVIQQNFNPRICLSTNSIDWYDSNSGSSVFSNTVTMSDNNWHHIAVTVNSHNLSFYIDGIRSGTATSGSATASNLRIGQTAGSAAAFSGLIDDVCIYNYSRTAEQIYNDYKTTHGTLVGDTKFVDGKMGKALQFDGSGDYVDCGNSSASLNFGTGDFSISFWLKPVGWEGLTGDIAYMAVLSNAVYVPAWSGVHFSRLAANWVDGNTNGELVMIAGNLTNNESTAVHSMFALSNNIWYHVVGMRSGTVNYLYINGILKDSASNSTATINTANNFLIGRHPDNTYPRYLNGLIDDVRIYNYARTADQVMQDYTAGASRLGGQTAGEKDPWGGAMPVGWWKLDENTGVLAQDASGNGNNGTLVNSPTWTQGKNGPALSFDGSNDYVNAGNAASLDIAGAITISAWFNSGLLSSARIIADKFQSGTGGYQLYTSGNKLEGYVTSSGGNFGLTGTTTLSTGVWYHATMVFIPSTGIYLYLNGNLEASKTTSSPSSIGSTTQPLNIGAENGASYFFNGKIDDVKIYNYARTSAQIAWDYNKGKPVGHWKFEEGSDATAYDNSGNGNTGTITIGAGGTQANVAAAWTNGATGKYGKCMSFDGTDDYVESGAMNTTITEKTLMAWVKLTNLDQQAGGVVGIQRDPGVVDTFDSIVYGEQIARRWMAGSNGFSRTFNSDAGTEETSLGWVHIAITYKANDYKIYRNGVQIGQSTAYGLASFTSDSRIYSGKRHGALTGPLNAKVDDVRVYNYARTADQVMQDYNAGAAARLGD